MRTTPRYTVLYLGALICLLGWLGWRYGAVRSPMPNPEDGGVTNGSYTSAYFGLSFPLPVGWTDAEAGPGPSQSGYYVLSTLIPGGEQTGTILIAAQDTFFAAEPFGDAAAMVDHFGRAMSEIEGMTIDKGPSVETIAGRPFSRVDYSGVGLYRAMYATDIRCHVISFNLTTRDPDKLPRLAQNLNNLSIAAGRDDGASIPACIKDYAVAENLIRKVEPAIFGSRFMPIPVRIVIGTDGGVKHVHVIHSSAELRQSVEAALGQWQFKPYQIEGRAVELETGLVIQSPPAGR
jgi:hypothetical protein